MGAFDFLILKSSNTKTKYTLDFPPELRQFKLDCSSCNSCQKSLNWVFVFVYRKHITTVVRLRRSSETPALDLLNELAGELGR